VIVTATLPDWFPWQLGAAIVVVVGIASLIGTIYLLFWFSDTAIAGTMDDFRDMGRRLIEWNTRRRESKWRK